MEPLEQRLAEIMTIRRRHGAVLTITVVLNSLLLTACFKIAWGYGELTFLVTLLMFWAAYHAWEGFMIYLGMKYEENRLRRAHEATRQNGQGRAE